MKRAILLLCVAAVMVGCGADSKKDATTGEFYEIGNAAYYDEEGEFDSLSYAMGMQIGLDANLRQGYLNLDIDIVLDAIKERIALTEFDADFMRENTKNMDNFMAKRIQPYQMAHMFAGPNPDESMLPQIYDEEYSVDKVSRWYGYDVVNYLHRTMAPLNMYWVYRAMEDSEQVTDSKQIDSLMSVTIKQMQHSMKQYMTNDLITKVQSMSRAWLDDVAQREGVEMSVFNGDTLYYRIDNPGSEVRPTSERDSVTISYDVYTFRGHPVESSEERASRYRDAAERIRRDTVLSDSLRNEQINRALADAERAAKPSLVVKNIAIKGAIDGMMKIGVGGEITMYLPGTLAYGSKGRQVVVPDEAIVMRIKMVDVKPYQPSTMELEPGASRVYKVPGTPDIKLSMPKAPAPKSE